MSSTGVGLNYLTGMRGLQVFGELDVDNIFNRHSLEDPTFIDRNVTTSRGDRNLAVFNPFTTEPVACPHGTPTSSAQCKGIANYQVSRNFGLPTSERAYQTPRTVRVSFGVRF